MQNSKAGTHSTGADGTAGSGQATVDKDELLRNTQKELRIWNDFPLAMTLIKRQSEVYHAAEEGAVKGKVFIYPIIAAFGQEMGAPDPSEVEIDRRMRLVELLAVVDRAPEPDEMSVFRMVDIQLALCPALKAECTDDELDDVAALLERMHDIGEYLQLEKRLCARLRQLMVAGKFLCDGCRFADIKDDKEVGPLLKATLDRLAASSIPSVLATISAGDRLQREPLNPADLLWGNFVLAGALGWAPKEAGCDLTWTPARLTETQLSHVCGQAVARRVIDAGVLKALSSTEMGPTMARRANRVVEALVVLGRGKEALQLVEQGGIALPKYLEKRGDTLVVKGA